MSKLKLCKEAVTPSEFEKMVGLDVKSKTLNELDKRMSEIKDVASDLYGLWNFSLDEMDCLMDESIRSEDMFYAIVYDKTGLRIFEAGENVTCENVELLV